MFHRGSVKRNESFYYPNSMGLTNLGSNITYGLLIESKDDKGATLSNVSYGLLKHGARILSVSGHDNPTSRLFTFLMVCDLKDSDTSMDDLVISIRKMKHVTYVNARCLEGLLFDEQLFPLVMMETTRIIAMNSDFAFGSKSKLNQMEKSTLIELGREYGTRISNNLKVRLESDSRSELSAELLESNIKSYLVASGWGKFSWESTASYQRVAVQDPPVSEEGTAAGNPFLQGMVAGLMQEFRGIQFTVMEDHYDPEARLLTFTLIETHMDFRVPSKSQTPDNLIQSENDEAIDQVERIISSIESNDEQNISERAFEQELENEIEST